jgi:hypothetical protein
VRLSGQTLGVEMRLPASIIMLLSASLVVTAPLLAQTNSIHIPAVNDPIYVIDDPTPLIPRVEIPQDKPIFETTERFPGSPDRIAFFKFFGEPHFRPWATLQTDSAGKQALKADSKVLALLFTSETTSRGFRYLFTQVCSTVTNECILCSHRLINIDGNEDKNVECRELNGRADPSQNSG